MNGAGEMKKIDYRKLCHPAHPEFRLGVSPFYLMAHADFDYHEDMSTVLEKHGVNRSMYRIMTVLREHESANIGFLAERSLTKRNTASRIIERMVAKELVKAFPNPDDSRITEVTLTQRGKDLLNSLTPIVGRQFQRAIDGIDNEELEQLVRILQKISSNLRRLPIEVPGEVPTERRVGTARLPAGQAWAVGANGPAGIATMARIEVAESRGQGIRLVNESPSAALRAGVKGAKDYLYAHAAELVGARNPKSHELAVEVQPLNGGKADGAYSVGLLLACCSALLKKQLRGGLVVVGELSADAVKAIKQPADFVEAAVREGARAILLPVSCRHALADVSDEVATKIEMLFYASASDALAKVFQE
jgi:MarR family transcriptional regulator, organic hydroperoxide resistance regulator